MAEYYFDIRDGSLLVGSAAIDSRLEEAGPAVVPLRELLEAEEFPYTPADYNKRLREQWSREEMVQLGSWALQVLRTEEEPKPLLVRRHLERLYTLGLGPNVRRQHSMTTMRELRAEVGSPKGHDPGVYDDWTAKDFARYAANLSHKLGRRPRKDDYAAADGPSTRIIRKRFGGVGELNEMIGYPNVRQWEPEDFVMWGVRALRANTHRPFNYFLLEDLSRLDRGPSESPIYRHFGTFRNFRALVFDEYKRQEQLHKETRQQIIQEFSAVTRIRPDIEETMPVNEMEQLQFMSKYALAKHCLMNHQDKERMAIRLAQMSIYDILRQLRKYDSYMDAATVETEAMILNVHSILWPDSELDQAYRVA